MSYANFRGVPMPQTAAAGASVTGTSAGYETLTAPAGPSLVDPGGGPGDLMIGSQGDNLFYVRDKTDMIQVSSGLSGVKSVIAYTPYALPANVQNLDVTGNYAFGVGNNLANLIIGHSGHQSLYGGPGDDVLAGVGDGTSFIVAAGEGNDAVYGFTATDSVRLIGSAFRSFADVQAAMRQVGSDVVLQIDPSETLTLRNLTTGQLTAANFLLPLDRSKLGAVTFSDDFNSLQLYDAASGKGQWLPNFGSDPTKQENYRLVQNGESQVYTTADFRGTGDHALGYNPFSVANGVLTITAQPIAPQDQAAAYGAGYSSGLLVTRGLFEQKYGYFEIRMAVPNAKGAWPAFWMVPDPNTAGVEADIGENIAIEPNLDHVRGYANGQVLAYADALKTGDHSGFHTYGMLWSPQTLTYYYDDVAIYQTASPQAWSQPMYMLVNLAVGGYGGPPDKSQFPASMQVDYVRAYALPDGSSVVEHGTPNASFGTAGNDNLTAPAAGGSLEGLAGADTLTGGAGANTLFGGDGDDRILGGTGFNRVNGNLGADTVIGKSLTGDWLLGGQGNDQIDARASSGHNIINGNIGADTLTGGSGGDTLRGGQGDDLIVGGAKGDWISGDRGTDTLTGGGGADIFHQFSGGGTSIVTDFHAAEGDRILLDHGSQFTRAQSGADVVVSIAGGGQVVLQNVQMSSLGDGWIVVA